MWIITMLEEFEDTKGVIRISKSKKNRQYNGQKKKDRRTNNDLQNITHNRSSNTNPTKNRGWTQVDIVRQYTTLVEIPRAKQSTETSMTKTGKKVYSFTRLYLWNVIPFEIRNTRSKQGFLYKISGIFAKTGFRTEDLVFRGVLVFSCKELAIFNIKYDIFDLNVWYCTRYINKLA
jgi:hypothetical protein